MSNQINPEQPPTQVTDIDLSNSTIQLDVNTSINKSREEKKEKFFQKIDQKSIQSGLLSQNLSINVQLNDYSKGHQMMANQKSENQQQQILNRQSKQSSKRIEDIQMRNINVSKTADQQQNKMKRNKKSLQSQQKSIDQSWNNSTIEFVKFQDLSKTQIQINLNNSCQTMNIQPKTSFQQKKQNNINQKQIKQKNNSMNQQSNIQQLLQVLTGFQYQIVNNNYKFLIKLQQILNLQRQGIIKNQKIKNQNQNQFKNMLINKKLFYLKDWSNIIKLSNPHLNQLIQNHLQLIIIKLKKTQQLIKQKKIQSLVQQNYKQAEKILNLLEKVSYFCFNLQDFNSFQILSSLEQNLILKQNQYLKIIKIKQKKALLFFLNHYNNIKPHLLIEQSIKQFKQNLNFIEKLKANNQISNYNYNRYKYQICRTLQQIQCYVLQNKKISIEGYEQQDYQTICIQAYDNVLKQQQCQKAQFFYELAKRQFLNQNYYLSIEYNKISLKQLQKNIKINQEQNNHSINPKYNSNNIIKQQQNQYILKILFILLSWSYIKIQEKQKAYKYLQKIREIQFKKDNRNQNQKQSQKIIKKIINYLNQIYYYNNNKLNKQSLVLNNNQMIFRQRQKEAIFQNSKINYQSILNEQPTLQKNQKSFILLNASISELLENIHIPQQVSNSLNSFKSFQKIKSSQNKIKDQRNNSENSFFLYQQSIIFQPQLDNKRIQKIKKMNMQELLNRFTQLEDFLKENKQQTKNIQIIHQMIEVFAQRLNKISNYVEIFWQIQYAISYLFLDQLTDQSKYTVYQVRDILQLIWSKIQKYLKTQQCKLFIQIRLQRIMHSQRFFETENDQNMSTYKLLLCQLMTITFFRVNNTWNQSLYKTLCLSQRLMIFTLNYTLYKKNFNSRNELHFIIKELQDYHNQFEILMTKYQIKDVERIRSFQMVKKLQIHANYGIIKIKTPSSFKLSDEQHQNSYLYGYQKMLKSLIFQQTYNLFKLYQNILPEKESLQLLNNLLRILKKWQKKDYLQYYNITFQISNIYYQQGNYSKYRSNILQVIEFYRKYIISQNIKVYTMPKSFQLQYINQRTNLNINFSSNSVQIIKKEILRRYNQCLIKLFVICQRQKKQNRIQQLQKLQKLLDQTLQLQKYKKQYMILKLLLSQSLMSYRQQNLSPDFYRQFFRNQQCNSYFFQMFLKKFYQGKSSIISLKNQNTHLVNYYKYLINFTQNQYKKSNITFQINKWQKQMQISNPILYFFVKYNKQQIIRSIFQETTQQDRRYQIFHDSIHKYTNLCFDKNYLNRMHLYFKQSLCQKFRLIRNAKIVNFQEIVLKFKIFILNYNSKSKQEQVKQSLNQILVQMGYLQSINQYILNKYQYFCFWTQVYKFSSLISYLHPHLQDYFNRIQEKYNDSLQELFSQSQYNQINVIYQKCKLKLLNQQYEIALNQLKICVDLLKQVMDQNNTDTDASYKQNISKFIGPQNNDVLMQLPGEGIYQSYNLIYLNCNLYIALCQIKINPDQVLNIGIKTFLQSLDSKNIILNPKNQSQKQILLEKQALKGRIVQLVYLKNVEVKTQKQMQSKYY